MDKHHIWLNKKPENNFDWICIVIIGVAFYLALGHVDIFIGAGGKLLGILSPFAGGIVIAYILDSMVRLFMSTIFRTNQRLRWVAIVLSYVVAGAVVLLLIALVVPQVISSVTTLFNNLPLYVENVQGTLNFVQKNYGVDLTHAVQFLDSYESMMAEIYNVASGWVPQIMSYMGNVAGNFVAVFTALAASAYMLADKEKLLVQLRTLTRAFLPQNVADETLRICSYANRNFSGFFVGKIIDSVIIWLICMVWFSIIRLDFVPLLSVVVGITNIIPVFGPFIGAVPCLIILFFVSPLQALLFLISILIIQQIDGNFIGPKILGQSIGISALWVLFSIVLGGDLFGIVGMILGVPVFATFYGLLREFVSFCLKQRGIDADGNPLPTLTANDGAPQPTTLPEDGGNVEVPPRARRHK